MRALTWTGSSTFRLNRMKPHGRSEAMNARSSALTVVPATPVMKAFVLMSGRIARAQGGGQANDALVPWDEALPTGSLVVDTELRGLLAAAKRADHRAINHLVAEIGTLDHGAV